MSKKKTQPAADWCDVVTCTCGKSGTALSEYTPTKLEVRAQYAKDSTGSDEYIRAISEFDRWLEAHDKVVAKNVQDRIIKLLEEHLAFDLDIGIFDPESNCQLEPNHIIALIKGEQK